ncbi:hypothetical protein LCGC14_0195000 [marine sediment metagenome]|uniref:Uncharacterized protein n=1 Tax=marine sediment metagenome TaxID=412755 RepID=A0A0F9V1R8_9ZZZZ
MRSVKKLSEQINVDYGIKTQKIHVSEGGVVTIQALGTTVDDIEVCMQVDSTTKGLDYSMVFRKDNLSRLEYLEFDDINAKIVRRFLEGSDVDFMHSINAQQNHTFIPA